MSETVNNLMPFSNFFSHEILGEITFSAQKNAIKSGRLCLANSCKQL